MDMSSPMETPVLRQFAGRLMLEEEITYAHTFTQFDAIPGGRPPLGQAGVVIADHHLNASGIAGHPGSEGTNDILCHTGKRMHEIP